MMRFLPIYQSLEEFVMWKFWEFRYATVLKAKVKRAEEKTAKWKRRFETMARDYADASEELRQTRNKLEVALQNAMTDPLTKLLNRRGLESWYAAELKLIQSLTSEKVRLTVFILDLDHFKVVNDRYGHDIGDQVLKEVGSVLENIAPSIEIIAHTRARQGGEEFAVLHFHVTKVNGVQQWVESLQSAMSADKRFTFLRALGASNPTFSIGSAEHAEADMSWEAVLRTLGRADKALYQAKDAGRDRWVHAQ